MSPDLHPEELLDKAAQGTLTSAEWSWLEEHLSQCAVCRLSQQLTADFTIAQAPQLDVDGLVARALAGQPTRRVAGARGISRWLAVAVVLSTAVSFAAVGQWSGVLPKLVQAMVKPEVVDPVVVVPAVVPVPKRVERVEEIAQPVEVVVEVPKPVVKPRAKVAALPPPPVVVATIDASSLFAAANQARISGNRSEAAAKYRELVATFPGSAEARLTRATLGRLLLDEGDARGALEQLEVYLSSGDEVLREEAMAARAMALGVIGRHDEEASAWRGLLTMFPESVHAARAQSRLDAMLRR